MRVFNGFEDVAAKVRYGADDEPDKYGFTKKMCDIADLVYDGKPLSAASFEPNEYDKAYYEECKIESDTAAAFNGGKRKKLLRVLNDIDPD